MENRRKKRLIKAFLLTGILVCLIRIGWARDQSALHTAQQDDLKKMMTESPVKSLISGGSALKEAALLCAADTAMPQTEAEPEILSKYKALREENGDLAGWLSIEGMNIDYPVMQKEDDEYYLNHDFYGEDSKYGCLYVRGRADLAGGTNFVIYGHNMKDGSMFGDLDLYADESFYREHPTLSFDTLYEERTYEIIAVFYSRVYNVDDDVFKYYQFYEADTQEEFDDFYRNIKELSLYDTGVGAEFGDTFLTLSTCAYHVEDGRFVVVARKNNE